MQRSHKISLYLAITILSVLFVRSAVANNLEVSNVVLGDRNPSTQTVNVSFDVRWDNAWRTKINHDAVWLTVRLSDPSVSPANQSLCTLIESGLNPQNINPGTDSSVEVYVSQDKLGAFIRLAEYGNRSTVSSQNIIIPVNYNSCGFADETQVVAQVNGIEMVYVPESPFYAGDHGVSHAAFVQGQSDVDPWHIIGDSAIAVANPSVDGFRYVSQGVSGEDVTGAAFTVSANFPKGYSAFYAMKYELTEGQWVEFINSLPTHAARERHDLTNNIHKNSDAVIYRNTISCSGAPLTCASSRPNRAVTFLSWIDLTAFLDWAALRPMTELEFEKVSRGPVLPLSQEYVWGSVNAVAATVLSDGDETGTETILSSTANVHFGNTILIGGDSVNGAEHAQGPLRGGIFATSTSTREQASSGYYGAVDLSGNVSELVVSLGRSAGRVFEGSHGDGQLTSAIGYEGLANQADWPGMDADINLGVTGADGSGTRGGSWNDVAEKLRLSDRSTASISDGTASPYVGGRGVRSYDGE